MPYKNREDQRAAHRRWYRANRSHFIAGVKAAKIRWREEVQKAKEKPCADCGVSYPYYVMDFDHRRDKLYTIAKFRTGIRKLRAEIAKCDVVCANCHRIRTHGAVR